MTKTETYEQLYIATNLEALELLAKRNPDLKKLKFQQICNALTKLYKTSQLNVLDQEKTYILLARYLHFYHHLKTKQSDKKFVELRFGSEFEKVLMQYNGIKTSLEQRYVAAAEANSPDTSPSVATIPSSASRIFTEEFIDCQQLFGALQQQDDHNVLIVDARSQEDYLTSRIKHTNCINVPDHLITAGLSANALGKLLPPEDRQIWELRDTFDVIILYDWNTTPETTTCTKLDKLRSALVDWDLNRHYNEPPVILKGGFLELLEMYPSLSTNPHVFLSQRNDELDELLELDSIDYPSESDGRSAVAVMGGPDVSSDSVFVPEAREHPLPESAALPVVTRESIFGENKQLQLNRHELLVQIESIRNEQAKIETEENPVAYKIRSEKLLKRLDYLQDSLAEIEKQQEMLKNEYKAYFGEDLDDESASSVPSLSLSEDDNSERLKRLVNFIGEERDRELQKARALKPKCLNREDQNAATPSINTCISHETRPIINRSNKPSGHSHRSRVSMIPLETTHSGWVGLRNIRNTCYMNTAVQCLRHIPVVKKTFCEGSHSAHHIRNPAAIIHETAGLIRQLWSSAFPILDPIDFYKKVGQLEPLYAQGHHEDCMEFFLFLLNHLAEDCCYDVALPQVMTPKQRAWYNQFEGKNSIFRDWFFHEIRIQQKCSTCQQRTYKFEIESSFMLSVPNHDFNLETLVNEYMDDYIIKDYCCAKCKTPVNNKKELCYAPEVMVVVLKRYRQVKGENGEWTVEKIDSRVRFTMRLRLSKYEYTLNAVVLHTGNLNFGHYTAACLTPDGWCEFNDNSVKQLDIEDYSLRRRACAFFFSKGDFASDCDNTSEQI